MSENSDIELQSDDYVEVKESTETGTADLDQQQGAESATASEPQHEENGADVTNQQVNQEAVNAAIDRQHAKYREEQRRRMAAEERLQQFEQGQQQYDPEPQIVNIDPYADDIEEQVKQRDESVRAHIAWQQRQQQRQVNQQAYQQRSQAQAQQEAQQRAETYFNRAKELKVDQTELQTAINTVGQYQLGDQVAEYIMSDENGPLVTTALSKNPVMLAELSMMQPHEAILHIERNVRSKLNVQPRTSKANKPPTRVQGRAPDMTDKFPLTGGKVKIR